jgi:beta propeller repeat protein
VDCRNGSPDIYGFNLSTFEEVQIIVHKDRQREPALYGRTVVWSDDRNGDWDIYCRFIDSLVPVETSSRTEHVRRNLLYLSGFYFFAVITAFIIGRTTWHTARIRGFLGPPPGVRDFRREVPSLWLAVYVLFLPLYSLLYLELMNSYYVVVVPSLFSVNILFWVIWGRKTPYIRITPDKIIIFTNTIRKPAVIELDRIREVQFHIKDKVRLLLSDGKKKDINLIPMDANDEVLFIDTLKEVTKS